MTIALKNANTIPVVIKLSLWVMSVSFVQGAAIMPQFVA